MCCVNYNVFAFNSNYGYFYVTKSLYFKKFHNVNVCKQWAVFSRNCGNKGFLKRKLVVGWI